MNTSSDQTCRASLGILLVLQAVMLAALFTQTEPHPPIAVAPFALGPFLGASLAMAVAALVLGTSAARAGQVASLIAAALALVSFGPQKWIDPAISQIWPAVLLGEIAVVASALACIASIRSGRADATGSA